MTVVVDCWSMLSLNRACCARGVGEGGLRYVKVNGAFTAVRWCDAVGQVLSRFDVCYCGRLLAPAAVVPKAILGRTAVRLRGEGGSPSRPSCSVIAVGFVFGTVEPSTYYILWWTVEESTAVTQ